MFTNSKKQQSVEAKPTLQDLVFLRRSKENESTSDRQPLAAIVKNNMNIRLSNINLEKRKPIYQTMRSPSSSCTQVSRRSFSPSVVNRPGSPALNRSSHNGLPLNRSYLNGSPSLNRSNLLGSSPGLNMSANKTFNNSMNTTDNDSLEIHGSYFINRSILNSPSERSLCDEHGSFMTTIGPSVSRYPLKHSAENVVEALKQKSKRKRASAELLDESNLKKKKIDGAVDSTLADLLQHSETVSVEHSTTSKNDDASETMVKSTGVQCILNNDEVEMVESNDLSKKLPVKKKDPKSKYGLTQDQINGLSAESAAISNGKKDGNESVGEEKMDEEKKESSKITTPNDSIKNKSVSFSDSPADKSAVKGQLNESSPQRPSLKLSALKNMESPYKRLFKNTHLKNITPESIKKMRKHPVYFSAKIDIDEVQRHCEEFGASGVSLKAFRLDKEEAKKRVDDIFDETDGEVDFKAESASSIIVTSVVSTASGISLGVSSSLLTSALFTSSSVKSNLFGTATSSAASAAPVSTTTSLTFGSLTSVSSLAPTTSIISVSSTTTVGGFSLQGSIIAVTTTTQTANPPAVSIAAPPTFNFGTTPAAKPTASTLPVSSAPAPAVVIPSLAGTLTSSSLFPQNASAPSGITFGTGGATTFSSTVQPSLQFPALQKPSLPPATSVVPTNTTTNIPVSLPATSNFGFNFQPSAIPSSIPSQASTVTATTASATIPTGLFGSAITSTPAPPPSFSFGVTPSTGFSKEAPTSVATTNPPGFSFAPAVSSNNASVAAPVLSANPSLPANPGLPANPSLPSLPSSNLFGPQPTKNTFVNPSSTSSQQLMFGGSTGASTAAATMVQPSLFGQSVASSVPPASTQQPPAFGSTASLPSIPSLPSSGIFNPSTATATAASLSGNIFVSQNKPAGGFNFASTTTAPAPSTGFSFSASTAPATGFSFSATTTAAASSGFSFTSTAAPTTFNFGGGASSAANSFGASSTPATQNNIFGQTAPASSSSQAPANIFGAPASTSQNMFGAPAATTAPATQGIFGSAPQSAFGASTQSTFGAATNQNVFGGATQQASIFGDQSKISSGGFNFGSSTAAASSASTGGFSFGTTTTTNSVFGQANVFGSSTTSNNVFAAQKPAENPNPFGQQPQQAKPSGFDFSSSLSAAPTLNFGGGNVFGAQQPTEMPKPSFNFGSSQPATPTFGATPASPAFGNIQQPAFGSPQPFGAAPGGTPGAGAGFTIGAGSSNPPPTRQTQRARRRLRR